MAYEIFEESISPPPDIIRVDCPVLVTERLVLRLPHMEDVDAIADFAAKRRTASLQPDLPYPDSRSLAMDFVKRASTGAMGYCVYAITLGDSGIFVGCCALREAADSGRPTISIWLGPKFEGMGYGNEAINALIDAAFRATPLEELFIDCPAEDDRARKMIEQAGFKALTGEREHSTAWNGHVYRLDRTHWIGLKQALPEKL